MNRYWSPIVHDLVPYVPGEQPKLDDLVKLNTNENPYGPSPRALEAIRAATGDALRLYPDPNGDALKATLGEYLQVSKDQIFVGNGSDEVLAHAFLALLKQERPLWFPDITYSFYPVYCGLYGIPSRLIPLSASFAIRPEDYLPGPAAQAGAIIFPNPNAPTGCPLVLGDIERIVAGNPDIPVVIDEAYVDFGCDSALPLVARYPNLLVVQTFSKSRSLAGLRVGFAVGHPGLIEALERVKNSFNSYPLDRLALAGAVASIQDEAHFQQTRRQVMATRGVLVEQLERLGFEVLPSAANFTFARHPSRDAAELSRALRARAIIVRHFAKPRIDQFLRITVGTDAQCGRLVEALTEILSDCYQRP
jgi:histidinol-phosphate aminotransferase